MLWNKKKEKRVRDIKKGEKKSKVTIKFWEKKFKDLVSWSKFWKVDKSEQLTKRFQTNIDYPYL